MTYLAYYCTKCKSKNVTSISQKIHDKRGKQMTDHSRVVVHCDDCGKDSLFWEGPWRSW